MNRGLRNELSVILGLIALAFWAGRQLGPAAALGLGILGLQIVPSQPYFFANRTAMITGGSRGLGLALAERLLREKARVVLLARDADELERARIQLEAAIPGAQILTIPCDVSQILQLERAFVQAEAWSGRLDLLVNNAGSISVGPFETMDDADFQAQIELQIYAIIHSVRLALPLFRRQGEGRIVNICSIGGDIPVPHMSAYCAPKFALAGLSETLSAELAADNIKVTTAFPGLMRTGSPIQAVFKGDHEREYGWFATGDVMPGLSVSAQSAARKILKAAQNGDAQARFPMVTRIGVLGHAAFPEIYAWVMRQAARFMPKGESRLRKTGAESRGWLQRQRWHQPLSAREKAAETGWNQAEKFDAEFNLGLSSIRPEPGY